MSTTEAVAPRPRGGTRRWLRSQLRNIAPFVTLLALVALFSAASPSFATLDNASNILGQVSVTAIIAVGLTFVILCGEIDLSVASVANAVGITLAYFTLQDSSVNIANVPLPGPNSAAALAYQLANCGTKTGKVKAGGSIGHTRWCNGGVYYSGFTTAITPNGDPRAVSRATGFSNAGQTVPRRVLIERVWGWESTEGKTLDTHIRRIRAKIETDPSSPARIVTVRKVGYRFNRPKR